MGGGVVHGGKPCSWPLAPHRPSPVLNTRWEEKPTEEEMVEVEVLLAELQKLKDEKLTGAAVALSFVKRLTQPIQERVHPGYEYSGREDPTRRKNRMVSRGQAHRRVMLIMSGEVRDKGCPKVYCLKRPTTEVYSLLVESFCFSPISFGPGAAGNAVDPPAGLALPAADVGTYSSNSSIGSESDDVVEVSGPTAGAVSTTKKQRPTRKVAASKAQQGGVAPRGWSSTPPCTSRGEVEAATEKAGLTTPKTEEEDQEEERGRPPKRASLSGAKRKAEESTQEARSAEGAAAKAEEAKKEVAASEPPQGDDIEPLDVAPGDRARPGTVEDPANPNVVAPALPTVQKPPKEKAPGERAVVTKEALLEAT
ncbi:hypothetical protein C2845_PMPSC055695 [Panicum miliaceum]|uniref:Uncharacterized protein n=1 Tax=Panicum miliaceum TaxID=4540 RepID=A0A3L6PAZ3_PANMI|nr:hypothetical protein C2845_PMPSC055695 [Panicum miliaceum]